MHIDVHARLGVMISRLSALRWVMTKAAAMMTTLDAVLIQVLPLTCLRDRDACSFQVVVEYQVLSYQLIDHECFVGQLRQCWARYLQCASACKP